MCGLIVAKWLALVSMTKGGGIEEVQTFMQRLDRVWNGIDTSIFLCSCNSRLSLIGYVTSVCIVVGYVHSDELNILIAVST